MYRSAVTASMAAGLVFTVTSATAAAPPPADSSLPAPLPQLPGVQTAPAPRFEAAPMPRQTDGRVRLSAPVAAPYSGTAYRDLGGQPETSADALDTQPAARPR
jgi:hypothetical protein